MVVRKSARSIWPPFRGVKIAGRRIVVRIRREWCWEWPRVPRVRIGDDLSQVASREILKGSHRWTNNRSLGALLQCVCEVSLTFRPINSEEQSLRLSFR